MRERGGDDGIRTHDPLTLDSETKRRSISS